MDKYFLPHSHVVAQCAKLLFDIWLREDLTEAGSGGRTVILTKGEEEEGGEVWGVDQHGSSSCLQLQLVSSSSSSSSSSGAAWLFFQSPAPASLSSSSRAWLSLPGLSPCGVVAIS